MMLNRREFQINKAMNLIYLNKDQSKYRALQILLFIIRISSLNNIVKISKYCLLDCNKKTKETYN